MCGIVGVAHLGSDHAAVDPFLLARMRDTMVHRGPDGEGIWLAGDRRVGFGHRRLSIIDLSDTAAQPMESDDGRFVLVFNGEIYNHAELRAELTGLGRVRWRTDHSDSEVLLQSFAEWGIDCLPRLRGMFAFAVYDTRERRLWLVRDRVGIKPLYVTISPERVAFASEIKALLEDPRQERRHDPTALYHYLSFLTTPAPQTLFAGIEKLAGGTWMRIDLEDGRRTVHRWWDALDGVVPLEGLDDRTYSDMVLQSLRSAVHQRAVSDVPVGIFLSGGLDSSTNAALFAEVGSRDGDHAVRTFSIGYDDDEYGSSPSELPFARRMADRIVADHHERRLSLDDLVSFLPRMVALQDEPIADPVCVPVYYVAELARQNGVKVCQVGEGSDELLFGYPWWRTLLRLQRWASTPGTRPVQRAALAALRMAGRENTGKYELLRRGAEGLPVFWGGAEAFTEAQKRHLLHPDLLREVGGLSSWDALQPIHDRFLQNARRPDPLTWMSYLDLNLRLPELLLMRVDKMTMGVSLEGRVPFLDHRFVETCLSIPAAARTRGGELKGLLKTAVAGLVPNEIVHRPKQGFGVPVREWFMGALGERVRAELDWFCDDAPILRKDAVRALLQRPERADQAWYLFNLALWWRQTIRGA